MKDSTHRHNMEDNSAELNIKYCLFKYLSEMLRLRKQMAIGSGYVYHLEKQTVCTAAGLTKLTKISKL